MEAYEKYERNGYTVSIYPDAMSPGEWDNLGTLYFESSRYAPAATTGIDTVDTSCHDLCVHLRAMRIAGEHFLPVRYEDHGANGSTLRVSDDEAANGFILTTPHRIELLGAPMDSIERQLRGEVKEWDTYFRGEVYGYVVETPAGERVDSLWGLYGMDYALEEANGAVDSLDPPPATQVCECCKGNGYVEVSE